MKKLSIIAMAVSAMMLAACGGQTKQAADAVDSDSVATVSFEQAQIEQKVMVELDSIAAEYGKLKPVEGVFTDGKIQLSDDEIKVKPDYLFDPSIVGDLTTNTLKYRAMGALAVDKKIAELYKMDVDSYNTAITKLSTDVNDPAVQDANTSDDVVAFYKAEKDNGRINLFWEAAAGVIIENLFVLSQNSEKLLPAFDDEAASNMTYHVTVLKDAIDRLGQYDADIQKLSEILAPVGELNAMDAAQLKEQVTKLAPQIKTAREQLFQ